jgi:hypothetical protein
MTNFMFILEGKRPNPAELGDKFQAHMQSWGTYTNGLIEKGHFVAGDPFGPEGRFVEKNGENFDIYPGIDPDSDKFIGGYYIVKAESLEQAAELATDCPIFETGGIVDVREIMPFDADKGHG